MYKEADQAKSEEARLPAASAPDARPAQRSHNLAPSGSFWRRFQDWERTGARTAARPVGMAC